MRSLVRIIVGYLDDYMVAYHELYPMTHIVADKSTDPA